VIGTKAECTGIRLRRVTEDLSVLIIIVVIVKFAVHENVGAYR